MFLNYIKNYFLLKILKNNLDNVKSSKDLTLIQTVGLLIDESYFLEKEDLISELIANGIQESNIKIIVYRDKLKKNEVYTQPTFGTKHLNWNAQITDATLREFIKDKFDLLISYYDVEKAFLIKVTNNSRAQFKVGFSSVDKRLNHLMINTNAENHTVFVHELFRYLKILNKI
ncbi:hypothetical protein C3L50_11310 [Flavobacterium alvei]|uniref:Uncharacterized protein n=1 Tax=Flavobacterium alvei TaxID=2080416 RepID=A0A2S5A7Z0_9FLAO|nr:hypothetical protein [Flavobacterium alvei]POY38721.1 hypothetical protein C3L50_11310 [Flavobacterium alvei]HQK38943.1 hypothetical protein [Flavobacterium alvei]